MKIQNLSFYRGMYVKENFFVGFTHINISLVLQYVLLASLLQFLEVIRLEGPGFNQDEIMPRDMYLLQVCT